MANPDVESASGGGTIDYFAGAIGGELSSGYESSTWKKYNLLCKTDQSTWSIVHPSMGYRPIGLQELVMRISPYCLAMGYLNCNSGNQGFYLVASLVETHGFFRGLGLPLVSYGAVNSVFFGVYSNTLLYLDAAGSKSSGPCYKNIAVAGVTGGVVQLFIACPTEVIKVRLQSQVGKGSGLDHHRNSKNYDKGPIDCFKSLYREGGLKRVYRGFTITAMRELPACAIYWIMYTWFMERTTNRFDKHDIVSELISGGMAGVISWYMIMPFDVVKSRMQADTFGTKYATTLDCVRQSFQADGARIFMKGALITALRAFPVNAATMLVYQKCMQFFNSNKCNLSQF